MLTYKILDGEGKYGFAVDVVVSNTDIVFFNALVK